MLASRVSKTVADRTFKHDFFEVCKPREFLHSSLLSLAMHESRTAINFALGIHAAGACILTQLSS